MIPDTDLGFEFLPPQARRGRFELQVWPAEYAPRILRDGSTIVNYCELSVTIPPFSKNGLSRLCKLYLISAALTFCLAP
jgi:hypothetical protein